MRKWRDSVQNALHGWLIAVLREQHRLIFDAILLGILGALSAQLFMVLLRLAQTIFLKDLAGYIPLGLVNDGGSPDEIIGSHGLWLIPLATTLGGLIAGLLIYSWAPEAEGHGTDTAVKAFHRTGGFLRNRIAFIKMIASTITIGSGGAGGREGPTALINAGFASIYATFTRRPDKERRLLVLTGMAAGLSAIFRSPIGTAVFVTEVLYGNMEFEASALIYTMLASVVAYAINGLFVGWVPLFIVPAFPMPTFPEYFSYALLGIISGIVATILPMVFYGARDVFHSLPVPPHIKPAIGGLLVGLLAMVMPQVLGGGYGWLQAAIDGSLSAPTMLLLTFGMILALSLTISSGGSGGVFAPSLFVGGMLGGALGKFFNQPAAAFVVVGMAAVFAGAARVPFAAMLMVTEMTGGYHLLAPVALTVTLSYFIQVNLSSRLKYKSLYEAQVPFRAHSPAHHVEQLESVLSLISEKKFSVPASVTHLDLRNLIEAGVPVDLPDHGQLALLTLKPECEFVNQPIFSAFPPNDRNDVNVIAIFRHGHMLLPQSSLKLRAVDQLLAIVSHYGKDSLSNNHTLKVKV